jgi:hypothetical protein
MLVRDKPNGRNWRTFVMTADEESQANCAICGRPIVPGSGRYRTEEGDVHEECYEKRYGKKPPRKA